MVQNRIRIHPAYGNIDRVTPLRLIVELIGDNFYHISSISDDTQFRHSFDVFICPRWEGR